MTDKGIIATRQADGSQVVTRITSSDLGTDHAGIIFDDSLGPQHVVESLEACLRHFRRLKGQNSKMSGFPSSGTGLE